MTTCYNFIMTTHAIIECLDVTSVVVTLKELKGFCEENLSLSFYAYNSQS